MSRDIDALYIEMREDAKKSAENPTKTRRVKSAAKKLMHKQFKPKNIANTVAKPISGALKLIPLPFLSKGFNLTKDKIIKKIQERNLNKKKSDYSDRASNYKSAKWDIKNLTPENLDKNRLKLKNSVEKYNDSLGFFFKLYGSTATLDSTCKKSADVCYAYEHMKYRMAKVELDAQALVLLGETMQAWVDEINKSCKEEDLEKNIKARLDHDDCGNSCYHR